MDGIIIVLFAVILYFKFQPDGSSVMAEEEVIITHTDLNPTRNLAMYSDEDAFMEVAHELGFR